MGVMVSAVMPTKGRPQLAARALECFLSQTYEPKELVILDDEQDRSFSDGVEHPQVRYVLESLLLNIPQKRNAVNALAKGEVIVHFDSDDFSMPTRITDQVARMELSDKAVTGYHSILFHVEHSGQARKYVGSIDKAVGTSLCYRKSWWEAHPFDEAWPTGSDYHFVKVAYQAGQLISVDGGSMIVARIHDDNTSKKNENGLAYKPVDRSSIPEVFA